MNYVSATCHCLMWIQCQSMTTICTKATKSHLLYKASERYAWGRFRFLCSIKILLGTVMLWNFPPSFSHQSATESNTHSKAYVTCHFNTTDTTAQLGLQSANLQCISWLHKSCSMICWSDLKIICYVHTFLLCNSCYQLKSVQPELTQAWSVIPAWVAEQLSSGSKVTVLYYIYIYIHTANCSNNKYTNF